MLGLCVFIYSISYYILKIRFALFVRSVRPVRPVKINEIPVNIIIVGELRMHASTQRITSKLRVTSQ